MRLLMPPAMPQAAAPPTGNTDAMLCYLHFECVFVKLVYFVMIFNFLITFLVVCICKPWQHARETRRQL